MTVPRFDGVSLSVSPFPHAVVPNILPVAEAQLALDWLRTRAPWVLRTESFYEQHEFSLQRAELGPEIEPLAASEFIEKVRVELEKLFAENGGLELVDVSAHRLTPGQTIRIHNDYIEDEETHRLLIQLNSGWKVDQGGLLMLFSGDAPKDLADIVVPTHGSGFAFEISPVSFHAVSSIVEGERYTIVYTFRRATRSEGTSETLARSRSALDDH